MTTKANLLAGKCTFSYQYNSSKVSRQKSGKDRMNMILSHLKFAHPFRRRRHKLLVIIRRKQVKYPKHI